MSKRKVVRRLKKTIKLFLAIIVIVIILFGVFKHKKNNDIEVKDKEVISFQECMSLPASSLDIEEDKEILINYLNQYQVSLYYENLGDGFTFAYNETKTYYAASTVKLLYALYLFDMASQNKIDLDEKIKYEQKNQESFSDEMSKFKVGSMHSIRDLIKYSLTVSDNTAYVMLAQYVGRNTIRTYAREFGMNVFATTDDDWGDLDANDANILLNKVYAFISNNEELGKELKADMSGTKNNYLQNATEDLVIHKYGWWAPIFHQIGIVYNEYPYSIAVLTEHGYNSEYKTVVKNIHLQVIKFHHKYIEIKEEYCLNQ